MYKALKASIWTILFICALAISYYAITFAMTVIDAGNPYFSDKVSQSPIKYMAHFLLGAIALTGGALQFHSGLRENSPSVHRGIGKVYLISVLLSGISALIMSFNTIAGIYSGIGFFLLAVGWLTSAFFGYVAIRKGEVANHKRWMIRNYALTLSAVTLRLYLGVALGALNTSFETAYIVISFACWVPNLLLAELYIQRNKH